VVVDNNQPISKILKQGCVWSLSPLLHSIIRFQFHHELEIAMNGEFRFKIGSSVVVLQTQDVYVSSVIVTPKCSQRPRFSAYSFFVLRGFISVLLWKQISSESPKAARPISDNLFSAFHVL
jgi:hypothetical protein